MAVAVDPLAALEAQIEAVGTDPGLDSSERRIKLHALRVEIVGLLGRLDRFDANAAQIQETDASEAARDLLRVRELASIAEGFLLSGDATAAELEEAGLLTHAELDALEEEGLLLEAVGVLAKFDPVKHPRARAGKFRDTYRQLSPHFKLDHPDMQLVPTNKLRRAKDNPPDAVARARRFMELSAAGRKEKRKPLSVRKEADGSMTVTDGKSTHQAAEELGLTHLPVVVTEDMTKDKLGGKGDELLRKQIADGIFENAQKIEPEITPVIQKLVADCGGTMSGLEQRLKAPESIADKIRRKQEKYPGMPAAEAAGRITDAIRYTAVLPAANYSDGVKQVMDGIPAGFKVWQVQNFWGPSDDYDGLHVGFSGPKGTYVELQFHTPDSLDTKEKLQHPIYEKFRVSHDPHERWQLWQQMVENTRQIPRPPGVDLLGHLVTKPAPKQEGKGAGQ